MQRDRILIVDDNPINLKLIRIVLQTRGYTVELASDAEHALAALGDEPPRLILMDLQLPGMDGLELTRRLKAARETRHIAIVAVTSYAMKGDQERALAAGCDGYVTKPIDTERLPEIVAGYLAR
jgi:CheY-like chemotaxis protein